MTLEQTESGSRSLVRRLAMGVSSYTLALIAAGSIRLGAILLVVRAMPAKDYGAYASLWVVMWAIHALGDLGLGTAAVRFAPECKDAADRRSLFGTLLSTRALVAVLLTAVVIVANEPLARWTTGSAANGTALIWLALSRPLAMVFEALTDELRARDQMIKVSWLVVVSSLAIHGTSVALAVGAGLGLMGLVWARAIGECVACGLALALCGRFVGGRPDRSHFRRLLHFGWPIGVMFTLGMLRGLDRPLIQSLASLEHVATYELAGRLVGPIGLVNIALGKVFEPFVYAHSQSEETPGRVDLFLRVYVFLFACVAMTLSVLGPEAITLLAPTPYHEAVRVLPALAFSVTCDGLAHVAGIGADLAKRTRVWAGAAILTSAIGLPLAAFLLPRLGLAGVGIAWVAAGAATTVFAYSVARRVSGLVLPVARALAVVVAGAALGTLAAWQPWPVAGRLVVLVAFAFGTWRLLGLRLQSFKWS